MSFEGGGLIISPPPDSRKKVNVGVNQPGTVKFQSPATSRNSLQVGIFSDAPVGVSFDTSWGQFGIFEGPPQGAYFDYGTQQQKAKKITGSKAQAGQALPPKQPPPAPGGMPPKNWNAGAGGALGGENIGKGSRKALTISCGNNQVVNNCRPLRGCLAT